MVKESEFVIQVGCIVVIGVLIIFYKEVPDAFK